jgi:hypothetical protein
MRRWLYWISTGLVGLLFAAPGAALLLKVPHFVVEMQRLGYPSYFLTLFGACKIVGASVVVLPRLPRVKEWAYAGLAFDALFAALSRAAIGDRGMLLVFPVLIGALVLLSWALRPDSRKLPEPA